MIICMSFGKIDKMLLVKKIQRKSLLLKDVVNFQFSFKHYFYAYVIFFLANNTGKIIKVNKVK